MNQENVLKLIDAGFTADEIRSMLSQTTPEAENQSQGGSDPGHGGQDPAGAAASRDGSGTSAATESAAGAELTALRDTVKTLQETVKVLQAANIKGAQQNPPEPATAETAIKNFLSKM